MRLTRALVALVVFAALAAPTIASAPAATKAGANPGQSAWTIAIYMSGDNTLSGYIQPNLDDIARANISGGINVVALVDESGDGNTRVMTLENHSFKRYSDSVVNASWGDELDLGSGSVLGGFMRWVLTNCPAENYALDLWGHGTGWSGACMDQGDWLTMPELSSALKGLHMNLISFDACQMGMAEVAYQLRGSADFLVSSEKDVPAEGWPYSEWLSAVKTNDSANGVGLALSTSYMSWAKNHSAYSATVSMVNLSRMDVLAAALDEFSMELWRSSPLLDKNLTVARGFTERYDGDAEYDLVHFTENVGNMAGSARLERLGDEVKKALLSAVAYSDAWTLLTDEPANHANGLSIWLPYANMYNSYTQLDIAKSTHWSDFLLSYGYTNPPKAARVEVTGMANDSNGDSLNDSYSMTVNASSGSQSIFELSNPSHHYSQAGVLTGGKASASFHSLAGGTYLAAAYIYNASGKLVGMKELPDVAKIQSWFYVNGSVQRNDGSPVQGATVDIGWGGGYRANATTNASGQFSARIVYPNVFSNGTISVRTQGAQPQQVNVTDGTEVHFSFVLEGGNDFWLFIIGFIIFDVAFGIGINEYYKWKNRDGGEEEDDQGRIG